MKHSILCVDDEADNVDALERLFRRKYEVFKTTSPIDALAILKKQKISVIISDQRMPQLTGVELLAESIKTHPHAIRILLTGYTDIESVVQAINSGQIYRYVTKPWDPVDLSNAIDKAVERFEIGEELVEKNLALQAALEELKTLDQAKNQFMVLVNHELKTPLTSMMSFSELLKETRLDEEQNRMLSRIQTAAHRLQDMISDALEFVSAETSQMRLEKKPLASEKLFSMSGLPETILAIAEKRGVKFEFSLDRHNLLCDEKVIRNVFRRLMHNAAKFADANSTVDISGEITPTGRFELIITNKGAGITPEQVARLMKPFTLNENVMNHSVGTGMGLSICQAMLKLHSTSLHFASKGGRIWASFELDVQK